MVDHTNAPLSFFSQKGICCFFPLITANKILKDFPATKHDIGGPFNKLLACQSGKKTFSYLENIHQFCSIFSKVKGFVQIS